MPGLRTELEKHQKMKTGKTGAKMPLDQHSAANTTPIDKPKPSKKAPKNEEGSKVGKK